MPRDLFETLPARRGHFLLESGYHSDVWLTLDELFADPASAAPLVAALGDRLRPHAVETVCGPLVGGAFLALAVATTLGVRFAFTEPLRSEARGEALFQASYRLPPALLRHVDGRRVAVVDDVISAGSSVRASVAALESAGASTIVVGTLLLLGETAAKHFTERGIPLETLERRRFDLWKPSECPLCRSSAPVEDPTAGLTP